MSEKVIEDQAYWQRHVEQFKASGLSKSAYARQEGLMPNRWFYWSLKLMGTSSGFIPVKLKSSARNTDQGILTVDSPQGWRLTVHDLSVVNQLSKLLALLPR